MRLQIRRLNFLLKMRKLKAPNCKGRVLLRLGTTKEKILFSMFKTTHLMEKLL